MQRVHGVRCARGHQGLWRQRTACGRPLGVSVHRVGRLTPPRPAVGWDACARKVFGSRGLLLRNRRWQRRLSLGWRLGRRRRRGIVGRRHLDCERIPRVDTVWDCNVELSALKVDGEFCAREAAIRYLDFYELRRLSAARPCTTAATGSNRYLESYLAPRCAAVWAHDSQLLALIFKHELVARIHPIGHTYRHLGSAHALVLACREKKGREDAKMTHLPYGL